LILFGRIFKAHLQPVPVLYHLSMPYQLAFGFISSRRKIRHQIAGPLASNSLRLFQNGVKLQLDLQDRLQKQARTYYFGKRFFFVFSLNTMHFHSNWSLILELIIVCAFSQTCVMYKTMFLTKRNATFVTIVFL
jgi:hypothetical protein